MAHVPPFFFSLGVSSTYALLVEEGGAQGHSYGHRDASPMSAFLAGMFLMNGVFLGEEGMGP
jgi:hypothetical protein